MLQTIGSRPLSKEAFFRIAEQLVGQIKNLGITSYSYKHTFADGLYIREMTFINPFVLAIGAIHKRPTTSIILKGSFKILTETGVRVVKAPLIFTSEPYTQRIVMSLEPNSVFVTLHPTTKTTVSEVVKDVIVQDHSELAPDGSEGQYEKINTLIAGVDFCQLL